MARWSANATLFISKQSEFLLRPLAAEIAAVAAVVVVVVAQGKLLTIKTKSKMPTELLRLLKTKTF